MTDGYDAAHDFKGADQIGKLLTAKNRPLRMLLSFPDRVAGNVLLPQRVEGVEAICDGIELRIYCLALDAQLPLKTLIGLPVEVQMVTDLGDLRSICGIVAEASAGESDGGLASYQLLMRDALAILDLDVNTRVFFDQSELDVVTTLLREARRDNPALAATFEVEVNDSLLVSPYPVRRQIVQYNEGTGAFIRRLLRRRGITWFFRPGRATDSRAPEASGHAPPTPAHTMVLLRSARRFQLSRAGTIRFHRDSATEERDSITAFGAVRALRPSRVGRHSWDYGNPQGTFFMSSHADSTARQGVKGDKLAATLEHYQVEAPHVRDDHEELRALVRQALARSDFEAKCYHAEGGVRNCTAGEYFILSGHPAIDRHPLAEREFIVLSSHITAQNNLPKDYNARVARLFARNRWQLDDANLPLAGENWFDAGQLRYLWRATCVRRDIAFVPAWDARVDTPQAQLQSAVVVGAPGEAVHCDVQGRVKVRFTAMRKQDHAHADGAGASDTNRDSAWVRVATGWAGMGGSRHFGSVMLPRPGTEVLIGFLGGDPDKPVIIGQLYNAVAHPPYLGAGDLPGNKYLSGIKSREIKGSRANQLRFDDTTGQINAQLASEHTRSELNLGWLTQPRRNGAGAPRGEGAELTTDAQLALRAGKGMLLSAWSRLDGGGKQLDRSDYLALMEDCLDLFRSLGQFAAQNQALPIEDKGQGDLQAAIKQWDNGSNTAPSGAGGGAAAIGLTAPAGISFASAKTIVSYAAVNIDSVAQQHLQMTAGQRFTVNAGKGISLFAHANGITQIAHQGKFLMQSQHDDMQFDAAKDLKLTAGKRLLVMAEDEVTFIVSGGAYLTLKGGNVEIGGPGPLTVKTAGHHWNGAASLHSELPTFGEGNFGRVPQLVRATDGQPVEGVEVHIELSDGAVLAGKTDRAGKSEKLTANTLQQFKAKYRRSPK
jgi:type VI secretion system secreted protein VgrG